MPGPSILQNLDETQLACAIFHYSLCIIFSESVIQIVKLIWFRGFIYNYIGLFPFIINIDWSHYSKLFFPLPNLCIIYVYKVSVVVFIHPVTTFCVLCRKQEKSYLSKYISTCYLNKDFGIMNRITQRANKFVKTFLSFTVNDDIFVSFCQCRYTYMNIVYLCHLKRSCTFKSLPTHFRT